MDKIDAILSKLPHFYAQDPGSNNYAILKAFADEFDIAQEQFIDRANSNLGIDTADARDLDWRFGSLLGFKRLAGETDDAYRIRLMNMVNALRGGTAPAIQYAVALVLGIADDTVGVEEKIKVYDAWEYENTPPGYSDYGNFVVIVRLNGEDFDIHHYDGIEVDINQLIDVVKAAGTSCVVLLGNTQYRNIRQYHQHQLLNSSHDFITKYLNDAEVPHTDIEGLYDVLAREMVDCDGVRLFGGPEGSDS